jgi:PncC family amidohydrolase
MISPLSSHSLDLVAEYLAKRVVTQMKRARWTLSLAESCTGGLISALITDVSGSSDVLIESAVTYANSAKIKRLGVSAETLEAHGAVSKACVCEMVSGSRRESGATLALSVSGIAGPTGGTAAKPVGTVFIGLEGPNGAASWAKHYKGSRNEIRFHTACDVFRLILNELNKGEEPHVR